MAETPDEMPPPVTSAPPFRLSDAPLTLGILAVNAVVFLTAEAVGNTLEAETLLRFGATERGLIWSGQFWRLLTSVFLHIGWLHILMNTWALFTWSRAAEQRLGRLRFCALYLLTGIGASAASVIGHDVIGAGASGAGFGLIGCLLYLRFKELGSLSKLLADPATRSQLKMIGIWFALGLMVSMDNIAHAAGLVLGVGTTAAFTATSARLRWAPVIVVSVLAALACRPLPVLHDGDLRMQRVNAAWLRNDWVDVLVLSKPLLGHSRLGARATEAAAYAHYMVGEWEESKTASDALLRSYPEYARALSIQCAARKELGHLEIARTACNRALKGDPNDEWTHSIRLGVFQALGEHARGEEETTKLVAKWPTQATWLLQRAQFRWAQGNYPGTEADFRAAAKLDNSASTRSTLAMLLAMLGRHDDAHAEVAAAELLEPHSFSIPFALCAIADAENDHRAAEPHCDRAVALSPKNGAVLTLRAWVLYRLGRLKEALEDIDAAMRTSYGGGWSTRAILRVENGELDAALLDVEEALRRDPRDSAAWLADARVRRARGDRPGALSSATRAAQVLPPVSDLRPLIEEELRRIEKLPRQ